LRRGPNHSLIVVSVSNDEICDRQLGRVEADFRHTAIEEGPVKPENDDAEPADLLG
jgi:hypothetical protein